jgi:MoxR-like ATPase
VIEYPERDDELEIVRRHGHRPVLPRLEEFGLRAVAGMEAVREMRAAVASITLSEEVIAYIVDIIRATRGHPSIEFGASPRAATMLATGARALAVIQGRDFVIPDDVKTLVLPTLRHRLTPTARADIEGIGTARILADLLEKIPAPR